MVMRRKEESLDDSGRGEEDGAARRERYKRDGGDERKIRELES